MDAHTLSLSAWAWRLLCDMLSAPDSRDGVGTPSGNRPSGRRRLFRRFWANFCVTLERLSLKRQNVGKQISRKSAHRKSVHKSEHQKQRKNHTKNQCENIPLFGRKPEKRNASNLRKTPAPNSLRNHLVLEGICVSF